MLKILYVAPQDAKVTSVMDMPGMPGQAKLKRPAVFSRTDAQTTRLDVAATSYNGDCNPCRLPKAAVLRAAQAQASNKNTTLENIMPRVPMLESSTLPAHLDYKSRGGGAMFIQQLCHVLT